GITFVLVTHDQEEALSMSDLVCVMNGGRIVQLGQPNAIYHEPADLFVAGFVGKTNLLVGKVASNSTDTVEVTLANGLVIAARKRAPLAFGEAVSVSVRPESLRLAPPQGNGLRGTVSNRIFLGSTIEYALEVPGVGTLLASVNQSGGDALFAPGEAAAIHFGPRAALAFAGTNNNEGKNETKHRESNHVEIVS
ncbi:MAG TPA: TOBE domain-containing protein, partial [Dongiaceae bacterium]